MKGLSFQNGIEYRIVIEGETWPQGEKLTGRLEAKSPTKLFVALAEARDKKVKDKDAKAFKIIEPLNAEASPLDWNFQLPLNARISDNTGSLYIVYGADHTPEKLAHLRLNIQPHLLLRDTIDLFTHHYRFALKNTVAGKDQWVEFKLDPPDSKDWNFLEQLILQLQLNEDTIDANFIFYRKEVDAMKAGLSTKITKREIEQSWNRKLIVHDFNQRLNKDQVALMVDAAFTEYRQAGWLS